MNAIKNDETKMRLGLTSWLILGILKVQKLSNTAGGVAAKLEPTLQS